MWRKLCLLVLAGACFLLPLVSSQAAEAAVIPTNKVRYVVGAEPDTLDPRKIGNSIVSARIADNLFEGLTTHGPGSEIIPGAAESWTVSPDGKVYTFIIRTNAKWSNGDPVTAQDFEYAWKTALEPGFGDNVDFYYFIAGAEAYHTGGGTADQVGVEALDGRTLRVTLTEPFPGFPAALVQAPYYPVNRNVDRISPYWTSNPNTFVGNGAFMMKSWALGQKIETVKNPYYWQASAVRLGQADFLLAGSDSLALAMYHNNQADLLVDNIPPKDRFLLLKSGTIKTIPYATNGYYCFNTQMPPFDNPNVRKAFSLAIDRKTIVEKVGLGYTTASGFVPWGITDASPHSDFREVGGDLVQFDPREARRLLAEAGYADGQGFPPITLVYNTNSLHKTVATAVQAMWKETLGVRVELENQQWLDFLETRQKGRYQVARHGWISDIDDPLSFFGMFSITSRNNDAQYKNSLYDSILRQTDLEQDPRRRMALFHQLERILIDDAVVAPIYFAPQYLLAKPKLKGVITSSTGHLYLKYSYLDQ